MATTFIVVEGVTVDLNYQLFVDGSALSLAGKTTTLDLVDKRGRSVDPGTVSTVDADEGKVKIAPNATGFLKKNGSYTGRFRVVDASSKVEFWPNSKEPLTWEVVLP
jgi:hypothetical protein